MESTTTESTSLCRLNGVARVACGSGPGSPNDHVAQCCATSTALVWVNVRRARMNIVERKADTRRKIQLGGLIVKAGLAGEEPAVLLGMLIAGARCLEILALPIRASVGERSATAHS